MKKLFPLTTFQQDAVLKRLGELGEAVDNMFEFDLVEYVGALALTGVLYKLATDYDTQDSLSLTKSLTIDFDKYDIVKGTFSMGEGGEHVEGAVYFVKSSQMFSSQSYQALLHFQRVGSINSMELSLQTTGTANTFTTLNFRCNYYNGQTSLPVVDSTDEGKVAMVDSNGRWTAGAVSGGTKLYKHSIGYGGGYFDLITDSESTNIGSSSQHILGWGNVNPGPSGLPMASNILRVNAQSIPPTSFQLTFVYYDSNDSNAIKTKSFYDSSITSHTVTPL